MILGLVNEAVSAGARQAKVCAQLALSERTLERWRHQDIGEDRRAGPHTAPINKLSAGEEQRALSAVNQPEFCDLPPKQIVPILAERGVYVAFEATVYRILRKAKQQRHRETTRVPRKRHQLKELVAAEVFEYESGEHAGHAACAGCCELFQSPRCQQRQSLL